MSISGFIQKGKSRIANLDRHRKHQAFTATLIILVGTASFGLGRLSALRSENGQVSLYYEDNLATVKSASGVTDKNGSATNQENTPTGEGTVVASKNGSKYHLPSCSGAKQINEVNKIVFASAEEARAAGYTPAANCKGLY